MEWLKTTGAQILRFLGHIGQIFNKIFSAVSRSTFEGGRRVVAALERLVVWNQGRLDRLHRNLQAHTAVHNGLRTAYSVMVGTLPATMFLRVPLENCSVASTLLVVFCAYILLFTAASFTVNYKFFGLILVAALFLWTSSNISVSLLIILLAIHLWGMTHGALDVRVLRFTVEVVSLVAALCVLLQTVLFYVFDVNLMYLQPWMVTESEHAIFREGSIYQGMYRPSAFFLEPSYFAQYCSVGVLSLLFPGRRNHPTVRLMLALFVTLGCVLTSSGMGIVICVSIFCLYVLFTPSPRERRVKRVFVWVVAAAVAFAVLMQFDFFYLSVMRIFDEVNGSNAFAARFQNWDAVIGSLQGMELWFGKGIASLPSCYITSLMKILWYFGIVGVAVAVIALTWLFIRSRTPMARCLCVLFAGLLVIANVFDFMSMTFWLALPVANASVFRRRALLEREEKKAQDL